jgi:hypothetical protein
MPEVLVGISEAAMLRRQKVLPENYKQAIVKLSAISFACSHVGLPIVPALRMWRQEDHKFEVSMGYIVRLCLKRQNQQKLFSQNMCVRLKMAAKSLLPSH